MEWQKIVNPAAVVDIARGMDQYCEEKGIKQISDLVGQLRC